MSKLVIYHANCFDGFACAWLFHQAFPDAEFVAAQYGEPPPDVTGKDVVIADFSYKATELIPMIGSAASFVLLDHHRTAAAELSGIEAQSAVAGFPRPTIVFDQAKSGGRLVWEWLLRNDPDRLPIVRPWLVDYTEDRDLWRWALPHSHAVNAALRSYPMTFEWWDKLALRDPGELAVEGTAILRAEQQLIDRHVRNAAEVELAGHKVLAVNATVLQSEIGEALAQGRPFSLTWFDRADGFRVFSLRSRGESGIDVSEVARRFGGGGHRAAAGFQMPERDAAAVLAAACAAAAPGG